MGQRRAKRGPRDSRAHSRTSHVPTPTACGLWTRLAQPLALLGLCWAAVALWSL
eukprot:CAMPEP_0204330718 /NCGR_PEP_ID=MMETSP0469-20131031/15148_1 /ASSEMBLY_ACC=CAM_ASM_000384 /TAXON_ID=2969 /ORGANISM="Oxyrrhis marina" /LENGTH=53 /DNA_ID=CAMNT_0051313577 /DNA_START=45 /DNA_END=202 /DNA_ORIENTATION=-